MRRLFSLKPLLLGLIGVAFIGLIAAAHTPPAPPIPPIKTANTAHTQPAPSVTHHTTIETQPIAFGSTTTASASLPRDVTQVQTTGVNGVRTLTYDVTLTNGTQTNKQLVKEEVTTSPVTQVLLQGTYVAPPATVSAAPMPSEGATARCTDGTLSYSAHRSGTCSHHGGVAAWY